jgi:murein DD-endopeptidase MepM/ murein hydrolase activator NlpD
MRLLTLICAATLLVVPAAQAVPADTAPALVTEVFPVVGHVGFGEAAASYGDFRRGHMHEGQDVFAPAGTPLLAVRDAVVVDAGRERASDGGRGNYVAFYNALHDETYVYMHMRLPTPRARGEAVLAGERIGSVGCTGSCDGDHLHFEIRQGRGAYGQSRDPLPFLKSLPR